MRVESYKNKVKAQEVKKPEQEQEQEVKAELKPAKGLFDDEQAEPTQSEE